MRRSDKERQESLSSQVLHEILEQDGMIAKLHLETGIHRTQLWRYATGRGKPNADQIAKLHRATKGKASADGWETLPVQRRTKKKARRAA